jgi:hypothetical protein
MYVNISQKAPSVAERLLFNSPVPLILVHMYLTLNLWILIINKIQDYHIY